MIFPEIGPANTLKLRKTEYMKVGTHIFGLDEFSINGSSLCPENLPIRLERLRGFLRSQKKLMNSRKTYRCQKLDVGQLHHRVYPIVAHLEIMIRWLFEI